MLNPSVFLLLALVNSIEPVGKIIVLECFCLPVSYKNVFFDSNDRYKFYLITMGAIWWGTRGTCPPHFFRRGGHNMPCPLTFFSLGFVFGEVSKIKIMFVTFCAIRVRW